MFHFLFIIGLMTFFHRRTYERVCSSFDFLFSLYDVAWKYLIYCMYYIFNFFVYIEINLDSNIFFSSEKIRTSLFEPLFSSSTRKFFSLYFCLILYIRNTLSNAWDSLNAVLSHTFLLLIGCCAIALLGYRLLSRAYRLSRQCWFQWVSCPTIVIRNDSDD